MKLLDDGPTSWSIRSEAIIMRHFKNRLQCYKTIDLTKKVFGDLARHSIFIDLGVGLFRSLRAICEEWIQNRLTITLSCQIPKHKHCGITWIHDFKRWRYWSPFIRPYPTQYGDPTTSETPSFLRAEAELPSFKRRQGNFNFFHAAPSFLRAEVTSPQLMTLLWYFSWWLAYGISADDSLMVLSW